jgi:hypothetical protein
MLVIILALPLLVAADICQNTDRNSRCVCETDGHVYDFSSLARHVSFLSWFNPVFNFLQHVLRLDQLKIDLRLCPVCLSSFDDSLRVQPPGTPVATVEQPDGSVQVYGEPRRGHWRFTLDNNLKVLFPGS